MDPPLDRHAAAPAAVPPLTVARSFRHNRAVVIEVATCECRQALGPPGPGAVA
jgi:hypothetical protein